VDEYHEGLTSSLLYTLIAGLNKEGFLFWNVEVCELVSVC